MPIDSTAFLHLVASAVEQRDRKNRLAGTFVSHFARYCIEELERLGLSPDAIDAGTQQSFQFKTKRYVIGGAYPKEVDVVFESKTSGPLLGISLKAPNSSIYKNVNNRLEEMAGEAANLHSRFPMLVLGHITVLPHNDLNGIALIDPSGEPTQTCKRYLNKLLGISGRSSVTDVSGRFEEVGVAFIDYDQVPVTYHSPSTSYSASGGRSIKLDDFFDRMMHRMRERNPLLFPEV